MVQFWAQTGPGRPPSDHPTMQSTQKGCLLKLLGSTFTIINHLHLYSVAPNACGIVDGQSAIVGHASSQDYGSEPFIVSENVEPMQCFGSGIDLSPFTKRLQERIHLQPKSCSSYVLLRSVKH